jgi:hypothetical protein
LGQQLVRSSSSCSSSSSSILKIFAIINLSIAIDDTIAGIAARCCYFPAAAAMLSSCLPS